MAKNDAYAEFLKKDFSNIFEELQLKELQKRFLSSRWLRSSTLDGSTSK